MAAWVVYNPLAGGGTCRNMAELLEAALEEDEVLFYDMTRITNYAAFLSGVGPEDRLILAGGDGTLHRFVNDTRQLRLPQEIFFFPCGIDNDYARDLRHQLHDDPFPVTGLLRPLPTVEIEGKERLFVNAAGFGLDGRLSRLGPVNAQVTVDGEPHSFCRVWLAPTLYGRYCAGGMPAASAQKRGSAELSLTVVHGVGRLRARCRLASLRSGRRMRRQNGVTVLAGREITVCLDCPVPLQIDGEMMGEAESYTVRAAVR